MNRPVKFTQTSAAADYIVSTLGKDLRVATPLGLGKPNVLLNQLYQRAKSDPTLSLTLFTALSLAVPRTRNELGRRFLDPFRERHWGNDYPELQYARDAAGGRLPRNVRVHEFYLQAGAALGSDCLQQDYQSINYTHVVAGLMQAEVRTVVQLVAKRSGPGGDRYSFSCNGDATLDLIDRCAEESRPLLVVGVVHPDLPFVGGEAEVGPETFGVVVEDPEVRHQLFALPRSTVSAADHAIGFFASQLIADDGTLQIGIGSLSDAVVASLLLRHGNHSEYGRLVDRFWAGRPRPAQGIETGTFSAGLYGLSEMVNDGFMHLRRAGILKRTVTDDISGTATFLHGAFYLGSREFYDWLRNLQGDDYSGLRMGRVSKVNDLYDPNEAALRLQRKRPRFLNTCMQVTLLGGAASETLENGRVVSGVGGQYNFVAMSHELRDSRSVLMLRSTRTSKGKRTSNVVWSHGHLTIPRHLRDMVVTEYGIADLKYRTDEEVIRALLEISDAEFQPELMETAKKFGKLSRDYQIPAYARLNTPAHLAEAIGEGRKVGAFGAFPLGSDFTPVEQRLALALEALSEQQARSPWSAVGALVRSVGIDDKPFRGELARMKLENPRGFKERLYRRLLLSALTD